MVLKDGFALMALSVLLFPDKAFPVPLLFFLWSFFRSHAGSFCDASFRDAVVRCVKGLNGSKIETLPMVA